MRAPEFWYSDAFPAALLAPLGRLYHRAGRLRRAGQRPWRAPVPVLCVGNLTAGGSGKTPTALSLGTWAAAAGIRAHFLTRGYGGRLTGPLQVDPAAHDAGAVGDEALLLAGRLPTWLARDRPAGARAAVRAGAAAIIMDDGLQNPSLFKDLSILVIDDGYGFGNGRLIPAGPLREPIACGLARVDAVVRIQSGNEPARSLSLPRELPVFQARVVPSFESERFAGARVLGFAGIGRPQKFHATLQALGADVVAFRAFPDHHRFTEDQVMELVERAQEMGARAVTTAKDAVRLPAPARAMVDVVEMRLSFDRADAFHALLHNLVSPDAR